MNTRAHWISLWTAGWLLVTGLSALIPGDPFQPPSWTILFHALPNPIDWIWPGLFTLAGLLALGGLRSTHLLVLSYCITALAYGIWGVTGVFGWLTNQGGNPPGSAANFIILGFAIQTAEQVWRNKGIARQVSQVEYSEANALIAREVIADDKDAQ